MKTCSLPDCDNVARAKTYCKRHYYRYLKYGDPTVRKNYRAGDYPDVITCTQCKVAKTLDHFYIREGGRRKRTCKVCCRANAMTSAARVRVGDARWLRRRDGILRRKYGIDGARYDELLNEQAGRCALCNRIPQTARRNSNGTEWAALHVDHDHETGAVRGLLCHPCNTWLGRFEDLLDGDLHQLGAYVARGKLLPAPA